MSTTSREGRCASCGFWTDAVTGLNTGDHPEPGDFNICLNCGHIMVFTVFGTRAATTDEMAEIMTQPEVVKSVAHIQTRGFIPGYRR